MGRLVVSTCVTELVRWLLRRIGSLFFFNDTATTEIYTLSLHDALPIYGDLRAHRPSGLERLPVRDRKAGRSEEHTSELQSRQYLVCRLLLEKKKGTTKLVIISSAAIRNTLPACSLSTCLLHPSLHVCST